MLLTVWLINNIFKRKNTKQDFPSGFNSIFDNSPFVVVIFNCAGKFIYSNQPDIASDLAGYNVLSDVRIVGTEYQTGILKALNGEKSIIQSKENFSQFFPWYNPEAFYELSVFPVLTNEGETSFIIITHREKIQTNQELKYQEEISKNIEKRVAYSFLSNISHELRTPLNWILGFSELIGHEKRIDKIHEYNHTINKGGTMLLNHIEKLIEMSCIARNTVEMRITSFDIQSLLGEITKLMQNEVNDLGKSIVIRINNEIPGEIGSIHSDRIKLKQVLLNIAHNSIKFTNEGFIEIGAAKTKDNEYLFYVKDTGIGIDLVKQKYIFELFKKADEENFHEQSGLGLGLAISNGYINSLGGGIWLESQPGSGSTIYFTIKDLQLQENLQLQYPIDKSSNQNSTGNS